MKLSVIIPMYNARDIEKNLKMYCQQLDKFIKDYELIVIDDGSTNNCFYEAKKIKDDRIRAFRYETNRGKGNAIRYGFRFVKGEYVAFLDSGGEFNPYLLKSFFELMNSNNADIIIGSKRHVKSKVHYPLMRRIMSRSYQLINAALFNLDVQDTQVGIKLFKRKVLTDIMPKILVKKFAYDIEILALAHKDGYKIIEAPIVLKYKFGSTINLKSVLSMFIDTLAVFYRLKILRWYDKKHYEK